MENGKWKVLPDASVINAWVDGCLAASDLPAAGRHAQRTDVMALYAALQTLQDVEPPAFTPPPEHRLRRDTRTFTGRGAELAQLRTAVDTARATGTVIAVHAVDGRPGVGKTAFVNHAA